MSASDKKKLRKELNSAAMTEQQKTAQKEQKKLKTYTLTFVIAMVLVVAIVVTSALQMPVTNLLKSNTTSVTVGNHEVDAAEFDYFYYDVISEFYSQASDAGFSSYPSLYFSYYYGLDITKPLDEQALPEGVDGEYWSDFFIESATEQIRWTYAMYDLANSKGHKLTEDEQAGIDSMASYMELYATLSGASSTNSYLKSIYGGSATMKSYLAYYEVCTVAQSYASKYYSDLEFTDDQIRERDEKDPAKYSSFSWLSYTITVSDYLKFLELGETTKGEDGKETTTYSDEDRAAALAAAKADAEALKASGASDKVTLDVAINGLAINKPAEDATSKNLKEATENKSTLYTSIKNEDLQKWLADENRKAGDLDFIEVTTGEDDEKTVTSYIVVLFNERIENTMNVGTVRHLLVKFEGGTKNDDGETVYSDDEKKKAYEEAEKYLKEYNDGEKQDEDAFTALVKKYSDDSSKSSGGLFEMITPDSGYVEGFTAWATAEHEVGDVEIIETEYGYHIMYYVEAYEYNYRDAMINQELVTEAYTAWEDEVVEAVEAIVGNLKYADTDYVISK